MPRLHYVDHDFGPKALEVIRQANAIIADYAAQGYDLTLRQLYFQFVSRDPDRQRQSTSVSATSSTTLASPAMRGQR